VEVAARVTRLSRPAVILTSMGSTVGRNCHDKVRVLNSPSKRGLHRKELKRRLGAHDERHSRSSELSAPLFFRALSSCPVSGDTRTTMSFSTRYTLNILLLDAPIRCSGTSSLIFSDWPCRLEWVGRSFHTYLKSTFLLTKVAGSTLLCSRLASTYASVLSMDTGQADTPARPLETRVGVKNLNKS
jgi:hypothetical protein